MSYKRRTKKGIPKNTDFCSNCKNLVKLPNYKREEDTNGWYQEGCLHKCTYLNITGTEETVYEFINSINPNLYSEEDLEEIISDASKSNDLHFGRKICGLYLEKVKPTGHFAKSIEPTVHSTEPVDLEDDDIPF